jgi:hypothetical protein
MTETRDQPVHESGARPESTLSRSLREPRRAALAVLAEGASPARQARAIEWMHANPAEQVVQALANDQVDQLFLHAAKASGLAARFSARVIELLGARRMSVAASVIRQEHVLGETCALLDQIGVEYVVFKGALVRQFLYAKPYLRPSVDVDLLVAPGEARKIARLFETHGYNLALQAHSDTHEMSLERLGVGLDLHWSLLRPGRMREEIAREIVEGRVRQGSLWGPSDTHLTVAMLVHPAITDHVTGRLVSAVDLDLWLRKRQVRWDEVTQLLRRIGLRTAAWAMLVWTHSLFETPVPGEVWRQLAPSTLRRRYLEYWLGLDPARLYGRQPWLVRGLFSLALQDRVRDAARAVWTLARKERLVLDATRTKS